jgi:hypothetical protein
MIKSGSFLFGGHPALVQKMHGFVQNNDHTTLAGQSDLRSFVTRSGWAAFTLNRYP